ncbi:MAG: hypothetical protein IJZ16_07265 [Clostridia bacterium]|nr:hypothetical protein [Clostridia bacterium]
MAKSILQTDKEHCYLCGRNSRADYFGLDEHHVFGGYGVRKISEKYGLKVYLCHDRCHEFGENAVHKNAEVDRALKAKAQKKAMKRYGWSVEDFIDIFGKNYL